MFTTTGCNRSWLIDLNFPIAPNTPPGGMFGFLRHFLCWQSYRKAFLFVFGLGQSGSAVNYPSSPRFDTDKSHTLITHCLTWPTSSLTRSLMHSDQVQTFKGQSREKEELKKLYCLSLLLRLDWLGGKSLVIVIILDNKCKPIAHWKRVMVCFVRNLSSMRDYVANVYKSSTDGWCVCPFCHSSWIRDLPPPTNVNLVLTSLMLAISSLR